MICLCMEHTSILEVDNGGSLVGLGSSDLLGGLVLVGDDLVGILLEWVYNLMSILWMCTLGGDSFVGRVWELSLMSEHCGVCIHTRQWCL